MWKPFETIDDENAPVIRGRPDFGNRNFGITRAKHHPPYVFSKRGLACLVHKIDRVEMQWYRCGDGGQTLVRLKRPRLTAHTTCGQMFFLEPHRSQTCLVPNPDAVLCGRCHGAPATFGTDGDGTKAGITRKAASTRLGCVTEGQ